MGWVSLEARQRLRSGLRWGMLALGAASTALVCTSDTALARHHRAHGGGSHHHASAEEYSPPAASILVDGNSGAILESSNPDALRHPASLTKVMTLYLLFERLDAGKIKLDTALHVSEHASEQAPTKLELKPGQSITVEEAIKGIVTKSANDAAVVVAENLGGDEEGFAKLMTQKAHALGMSAHDLCQRFRPAGRRPTHHCARPSPARARDPGSLPALLQVLLHQVLRLSRRSDAQSQPPARRRRRRRRHQDRLYPRVGLQPSDLAASRRTLSGRCRHGRSLGIGARRVTCAN